MTKFIIMSMADPSAHCVDYAELIQSAIKFASHNLKLRHHITIEDHSFLQSGDMMLQLIIPDKNADKFRPGPRLKGIGQYLLNHHPDIFKPKLIGTRLFSYEILNSVNFVEKVLGIELISCQKEILEVCEKTRERLVIIP